MITRRILNESEDRSVEDAAKNRRKYPARTGRVFMPFGGPPRPIGTSLTVAAQKRGHTFASSCGVVWLLLLAAAANGQTGFPFQDESLRYSVNWPSGLSLGDATFTAHKTSAGWSFDASLEAGVPGFAISDKFHSSATADLCSLEFERSTSHGAKKTSEKTTFDQHKLTAHRVTVLPADGGKTDFDIPSCARDALTFVYFARREMGQGRVAPAQKIFFGSAYGFSMQYTGAMNVTVGEKLAVTDRVVVSVKGPKSDVGFEIFFARDAARTPLLLKVPMSMGTFSVELVR